MLLDTYANGPLEQKLRQIVTRLPDAARVELKPFMQLEATRRCCSKARAFVLASSSDQWGLVVNEAMAAGLPVLVSHACGCSIDLVEDGVSGWCFDPDDRDALTALLHRTERHSAAERTVMLQAPKLLPRDLSRLPVGP